MRSDDKPLRPEVLAAFSQLPQVTAAMREAARDIQRDAKALAPKRTGRLSRGILIERDFDQTSQEVRYLVGWSDPGAFYGPIVEFGHEAEPARPHLVPAAIANGAVAPGGEDVA